MFQTVANGRKFAQMVRLDYGFSWHTLRGFLLLFTSSVKNFLAFSRNCVISSCIFDKRRLFLEPACNGDKKAFTEPRVQQVLVLCGVGVKSTVMLLIGRGPLEQLTVQERVQVLVGRVRCPSALFRQSRFLALLLGWNWA